MQSALQKSIGRAYSLPRCTLCGHRLPTRTAGRLVQEARNYSSNRPQVLRLARWEASSSSSYHTAIPWPSRTPAGRRSFATVVEPPKAPEDDLPEPVLKEGSESPESTLTITAAAEKQLALIQQRDNDPNLALRILVESGGCHGYSTKLQLANIASDRAEDDYILRATSSNSQAVKTGLLLVDALTLSLIKGSTLDYATELIGSSFRLIDNPQASGKGCGCGVSWEMKI